jgi:VanZ family protein
MNMSFGSILRLVPMVIVMGTIFLLSHQSGGELDVPPIEHLDKLGHFVIYGLLAATVIWAPPEELKQRRPKLIVLIAIIFCFLYGISDEFHQSFIPDRSVSGADLAADLCGILFVSGIWIKRYQQEC